MDLRIKAAELIAEAVSSGARVSKACACLGISVATYHRWKSGSVCDKRKGAAKSVPRKLSQEEEQAIVDACCSDEYKDMNPYEIHASLLDKGIYLGSVSSFYRILRRHGLMKPRNNSKPGQRRNKPDEKKATGPNQVWCWDITWLRSEISGLYFYAYVIIDVWDRGIVKWAIHEREDDALAAELFQAALRDNGMPDVYVHSDNGNPMKGVTLLALFYALGLGNGYSRPRVSNDNPFIESWFKTLKYTISNPKSFSDVGYAREWFAEFVYGYNESHRHSGIHFMTPAQLRKGEYEELVSKRNTVMMQAFEANPQRWSGQIKQLPRKHIVYLNPTAETRVKIKEEKAKVA